MAYLLENLAELAERRARNVREKALMWDILARDLKRAYKEQLGAKLPQPVRPKESNIEEPIPADRPYGRVKEA